MKYKQTSVAFAVASTLFGTMSINAADIKFTPGLAKNFANSAAQVAPGPQLNAKKKQYIITFRDNSPNTVLNAQGHTIMSRSAAQSSLSRKGVQIKRFLKDSRSVTADLSLAKFQELQRDPNVIVEEDHLRFLYAQNTPWGIPATQSTSVSDSSAGNIKVCIIDSGYDISNPDLAGNNHAGTNDSGTGNWYQPGGSHGTHVAGTIAAINNSEGVVGVMPNQNVNIHVVKVFNAAGWGYSSDLADAINTCTTNGSNVVNMSLGGSGSSTAERNALQASFDSGALLIAASGNAGNTTHSYPASYDSVVSVGATDENNQWAEFSQYTNQVELSAPGEAVLSTVGGDGAQGYITVGGTTYGDDRVVPSNRLVTTNYTQSYISGSATGTLAACSVSSSGVYSCGNMNNKVCLVERYANQKSGSYPETNPVKACSDAGAAAIIVYSNSARPGLQNPFLLDANSEITVPTVSVNRTLGQSLAGSAGSSVTVQSVTGTNYSYYNGTSMATPHVAGVAALVWSNNRSCTNAQIRAALNASALDRGDAGRDDKYGHGIVQAQAAMDYLADGCDGPVVDTGMQNGVAITGLSGSQNQQLTYTMTVPAGATDLSFAISGGTGDADLYVRFGSAPTTSTYDCRPWKNGNNESCPISNVQAGTYHVMINGYSSFSGVSLVGNYTEGSTGGGGGAASFDNTNNYNIPDNNATGITSTVNSTRSGASGSVTVEVDIVHTYIGDLIVDLIHPDGTVYNLHNRTGGSANNINNSYAVNAGSKDSAGTWSLRVRDRARQDTGYIDNFKISFQ